MPPAVTILMRVCVLLALAAHPPGRVAAADPPAPASRGQSRAESRDALLLFDEGVAHLRFHITLGGRGLTEIKEDYIDAQFRELDTDGDGRLSRHELAQSRLKPRAPGGPRTAYLEQFARNQRASRADLEQIVHRVITTTTVTYRQDESAAQSDLELFRILDADGSGMVEPGEMRTAALRILDRDGDRDQCVTFDEFLPRPEGPLDPFVVALPQEDPSRPKPTPSEVLQDLEAFVPLLGAMRRKYDLNRDQRFSAEELNWNPERIRQLDEDGDGLLSAPELQGLPRLTPDLELAIELLGGEEGSAVRILSAPGAVIDPTPRVDVLRVRMAGVQLTFSHRETDPVREAVDTALRLFNQLDRDANGYLDAAEALARGNYFHESVFLEADRDGDGQLFGPELQEHVAARATPLANCCRVNIYNTGFGLFQQLDASGDGRISLRELRTVERVLYELVPKEAESLSPQAGGRHLHIEFVRGSYHVTGPNDGMVSQTPAFAERPPVGPDWFRAMDRNSDGDLTFQEFLGPREAFHALDMDGDGLIDFREAEAADNIGSPETGPLPVSETARSPAAASVRRGAPDSPQP